MFEPPLMNQPPFALSKGARGCFSKKPTPVPKNQPMWAQQPWYNYIFRSWCRRDQQKENHNFETWVPALERVYRGSYLTPRIPQAPRFAFLPAHPGVVYAARGSAPAPEPRAARGQSWSPRWHPWTFQQAQPNEVGGSLLMLKEVTSLKNCNKKTPWKHDLPSQKVWCMARLKGIPIKQEEAIVPYNSIESLQMLFFLTEPKRVVVHTSYLRGGMLLQMLLLCCELSAPLPNLIEAAVRLLPAWCRKARGGSDSSRSSTTSMAFLISANT